ncbi:MAG: hypothetical protein GF307_13670 [candidate division Zixibacteria bacterium]|nr:hypothetical protein [candidate division Zixibacteria bacterium]
MEILRPIIFFSSIILILGIITFLIMRFIYSRWWTRGWIKTFAYGAPLGGIVFVTIWMIGTYINSSAITIIGAIGFAVLVIANFAMIVSAPISGAVRISNAVWKKINPSRKTDISRRRFIARTIAAVPAFTLTLGGIGTARSFSGISIPEIPMKFRGLAGGLDGLKILQISDAHLGYYVFPEDIENLLAKARPMKPDIILLTGDISDQVETLPAVLEMVSAGKPRYGAYACLGNHEYYRGISKAKQAFENSDIPLLINRNINKEINGARISIIGVDDPRYMQNVSPDFYRNALKKGLAGADEDSFKLLLCHRPDGFDSAAEAGINLTLSGHTHGAQVGLGRRSVLEGIMPEGYLWGKYSKPNGSLLYTSSGVGHWFPFRLGCPREAPLIILKSA